MTQVNVGIIGFGYWGPNLTRNFMEMPDSKVVAVADLSDDRLNSVKTRYPEVHITKDYKELFSMSVDAVVVATPPATHYKIAKECLENGLHCLIEKPITLKSEDAEGLIAIAAEKNLRLMVGHTFEYNGAVRTLRELIQSGEIGDVYYINSVRANLGLFQRDSNVMWDLAPHDISILRYILGADPIMVGAQGGACVFKESHDIVYMHLKFPNEVLANIHVSWLDPSKVRRITVVGSKKMVIYDDVENLEKIKIYDKGVERPPYTDTFGDFQLSYRYGDVTIPHLKLAEPLRTECQHFLDCIRSGEEPQSNGRVGLTIVQTMEAAERSLAQDGVLVPMASSLETA